MKNRKSVSRPLSQTDAALRFGVKVLPWIPPRVLRFLAGRRAIVRDGNTLDPTLQFILAAQRWTRTGGLSASGDVWTARGLMRSSHSVMGNNIAVDTTDFTIVGPGGELPIRHYRPATSHGAPLLVFFHGGGFVVGDIVSHDGLCREICRDAEVHVLSVEYRLAPEHPAPAALDDCLAAYRWACEHAEDLGADSRRIGVGGDSAGGNLTALVTLACRDHNITQPALQILIYPALDLSAQTRSRALFSDGFFVNKQDIDWFNHLYLDQAELAADDPQVSPLKATDLSGLAPALIITAGFDPLRDEGNAYAEALQAAGVPVDHRQFDTLAHGFASTAPLGGHSADAITATISAIRAHFSRTPSTKHVTDSN